MNNRTTLLFGFVEVQRRTVTSTLTMCSGKTTKTKGMPTVELQAFPLPFLVHPFLAFATKNMLSREDKKDQGKLSKFQPTQALTSTGHRTLRVDRKCTGVRVSTPLNKWNLSECILRPIAV